MEIPRFFDNILDRAQPGKVLVLYGPRQVGKTTLLRKAVGETKLRYRFESGEDLRVQEILGCRDLRRLKEYLSGYDLLVVDEAQKVPGIGDGLKLIVDGLPGMRVIASGSSSFELAGQVGEPLTGRKTSLVMYPAAILELSALIPNRHDLDARLDEWLVFGGYPEVITSATDGEKSAVLHELVNSYLLKDLFAFERVKNPKILLDLLRLLAYQVGSEVSLSEISTSLGVDYKTVGRYIDLLEKSFVLFSLGGFSRNLRTEMIKKKKYYFYDNGIRNAIISNLNSPAVRNDTGALWENFIFMERMKARAYKGIYANIFFWRTWSKKEIDLIEERDGKLFAYEFKLGKKTPAVPREWRENYSDSEFTVISRENYLEFIG